SARLLKGNARPQGRLLTALARRLKDSLDRLAEAYGRLIRTALVAPWAIITGSLVLLASSLLLLGRVGTELMSPADEGRLAASVELPVGTPLETTKQVIQDAERRLRERIPAEEIEHLITNAGPDAWWRPGGSHHGGIDLMSIP